jgi:cellulose biosynthesis protein BcsQ
VKTIAFFNNKGGVGKTTLVYHIAWMAMDSGHRVLAIDLDPQANLTSMFLGERDLEAIWPESGDSRSVLTCISPIMDGTGDIAEAPLQQIRSDLHLIPGDLGLSRFEDRLSDSWPRCLDRDPAAFRVLTAFYRIIHNAVAAANADLVLMDVGPNLGAINRAALIASESVVMPLAPGLFSLQGLRNLGPTLTSWRASWAQRIDAKPATLNIPMPSGAMQPAGYVVMQHVERRNRPVKAYQRWVEKIPSAYQEHVLRNGSRVLPADQDPNCIGFIKNYQSLMPLAEDSRKPIFKLTAADGAIGAHSVAVSKCYMDFQRLTEKTLERTGAELAIGGQ